MKINERAADIAINTGGFLLAGDYAAIIKKGDYISLTECSAIEVSSSETMRLIDAPEDMIFTMCRSEDNGFRPVYAPVVCETPHQAALAQMMHDAGEGIDLNDLFDVESLDAIVTVVRVGPNIKQRAAA